MIALTCISWSIARNRTNTIRSRAEPYGVSNPRKPISDNDSARLLEGNLQLRRISVLIRVLLQYGIPWILENPDPSTVFWTDELREFANDPMAESITIDQCAFGTPWRKRTRLSCGNCDSIDLDAWAQYRCRGKSHL